MRPNASLAPHKTTSQPVPRSSPHPYLFLSWPRKQMSILSGMCICEFQSRHPLTAALSFRIWGILNFHVVVQETMCCVTLDHGRVQQGPCSKRMASLYILQRSRSLQLSIPGHSSAPSISHQSMLGLAGPCTDWIQTSEEEALFSCFWYLRTWSLMQYSEEA